MPGDDLVPRPLWEATGAMTIDAPAAEVWPWVTQMGYGGGGLRLDPWSGRHRRLPAPRRHPVAEVGDIWLDGTPSCSEGSSTGPRLVPRQPRAGQRPSRPRMPRAAEASAWPPDAHTGLRTARPRIRSSAEHIDPSGRVASCAA